MVNQPDSVIFVEPRKSALKLSSDSTTDFQSLLSNGNGKQGSFFTAHQLSTHAIRPRIFTKYQPDWIVGLLLFCFVLLAWAQVFYRRRLRLILMAPFSKRFLSQLVREGDLFSERISLAGGLIYLLTTSLFLYQVYELMIVKDYRGIPGGWLYFIILAAALCGFWILKVGLIRFLSFIFRTRATSNEYLLNILIFNILSGLALLPLLVFAIYLKSGLFLIFCMISFAIFFVFRFFRGFLIGISITKFSYVFLFVYLCSLEILPLVVLMKVVLKYFI
jgi:hypothetical protein